MDIAAAFIAKIGERLVESTIHQVGYLFCFNGIVEDLMKEGEKLILARDAVQLDVERAVKNTEEVEECVQKWLMDVSKFMEDVKRLEEEIQVNKACFNGWCPNWGRRYWLSRKAVKKTSIMLKLQDGGKFNKVSHLAIPPGIEFFAPKDFMSFEPTRYAFDQIIEALKDDKINIVGLYGIGGVGKTTLAKVVGNEAKEQMIFDEVVIVVFSQTPSVKTIQGQLADSLSLKLDQEESEEGRAKRLYLRLTKSEKILIILDDVWENIDLKTKIGIPCGDGHKGCKILLTTRRQHVCTVIGCQARIPLNILNETEGLALLKRHAEIGDDSPILNAVAIGVAKECNGLPLAIVTIGSALREKTIDEWKVVSQKLKKSKLVDIDNVDVDVYACLRLSYDYLKGEEAKLNFLLCSLFPEDYEITLEILLRYGLGLGLYKDVNSIDEARYHLRAIINNLKASCLLLDAKSKGFVKMHDIVRDVALWIASSGKKVFMVKAGMGFIQWPKEEDWEQYTGISLMVNQIEVFPIGLICPKLEILLLDGKDYKNLMKVSNECFKEMKALKVVTLRYVDLSLKSLQFLTNLKSLDLFHCNLRDISYLRKLSRLEFLSLKHSWFHELTKELGELGKLRMLDLRCCQLLESIPSDVVRRFSQLEELYIDNKSFKNWDVQGMSAERSNASLFELNSLSRLSILFLNINGKCLPKDFVFPKLLRYDISVNISNYGSYPATRALRIRDIDAASLIAFETLYHTVEYLHLIKLIGCHSILPSIDQAGLNELKSLTLIDCDALEYVLDMTQQQVPAKALSNLAKLSLKNLILLREICYGGRLPGGFLETLQIIHVTECTSIFTLFPAMLLLRLCKLKEVKISSCDKLQEVFKFEGLCNTGKENLGLLPSLAKLSLEKLPQLRYIWKGPTEHVNLRSLIDVEVTGCKSLTYLFSWSLALSLVLLKTLTVSSCESLRYLVIEEGANEQGLEILSKLTHVNISSCEQLEYIFPISIARGLVHLEEITVKTAAQLKQVFYLYRGREENLAASDGRDIMLPKLRELTLYGLENLVSFCPENFYSTWPALEEFTIEHCPNFTMPFNSKEQDLTEKLCRLRVRGCHQFCQRILTRLKYGFKNLEYLNISNCRVRVVFQLEGPDVDEQEHKLSLSSLKGLELKYLEELEVLCKGPKHFLTLKSLTILEVKHCPRLKRIFTSTLAQNLSQLKTLLIKDCGELEQIIFEDDEEDQTLLKEHFQPVFFPNLLSVYVDWCHKLKHLFPITIAQDLQQLRLIKVAGSFQLEEVFGCTDRADVMEHKEMVLPELQKLSLQRLPSLINVCPVGYHFIFPSLGELRIKECPKTATTFSFAQDGSVHAEAKALKIGKEDRMAQFPPESIMEIHCWQPDDFRERLPPYIEN